MKRTHWIALLVALLVGCGGGSDDSGPSTANFAVDAALTRLASTASAWTAVGDYYGRRSRLDLRITPLPGGGFSAESGDITLDVDAQPAPLMISRVTQAIQTTRDDAIATPAPATAITGLSGRLFEGNWYMRYPTTTVEVDRVLGRLFIEWSLEGRDRHSSDLCVTFRTEDAGPNPIDKFCFAIEPSGATTGPFRAELTRGVGPHRETFHFR